MRMENINKILHGNCLEVLKSLPDNSVDCCVTSPPYFGLRDYGNTEQIGLEPTPELFVQQLLSVFVEVKRVLKPTGTLWVNMGDSYAGSGKGSNPDGTPHESKLKAKQGTNFDGGIATPQKAKNIGLKAKDLIGIPWMLAFALRANGWYLRQDIIWNKPNPMPESVTDRCTKAHEYIFLLSKSRNYFYDAEAIKEYAKNPADDIRRIEKATLNGKSTPDKIKNGIRNSTVDGKKHKNLADKGQQVHTMHRTRNEHGNEFYTTKANKRSVWTVTTQAMPDAHFATFPERLIDDCIKAGCPPQGIVLDPFMGAGTTALVARKLDRNFIGIELNKKYIAIAERRLRKELGMFYEPINEVVI